MDRKSKKSPKKSTGELRDPDRQVRLEKLVIFLVVSCGFDGIKLCFKPKSSQEGSGVSEGSQPPYGQCSGRVPILPQGAMWEELNDFQEPQKHRKTVLKPLSHPRFIPKWCQTVLQDNSFHGPKHGVCMRPGQWVFFQGL